MNKFRLKAMAYIVLYLLATPPVLLLTLCLWICGTVKGKLSKQRKIVSTCDAVGKKTVLVMVSSNTKALHLCRILGKAGHRVILADVYDHRWSGARYSKYISKFYCLPVKDDNSSNYVDAVVSIAEAENIDWYIPSSRTMNLEKNLLVAHRLRKLKPEVRCLTPDTLDLGLLLDNKLSFMSECKNHGLRVPEYYSISQIDDVTKLREQGIFKGRHFFLKPIPGYNVDRENFSAIPNDEVEFRKHLKMYESKIRPENPYFVCEFIKGKEFTSAVLCDKGKILALNITPSCSIQDIFEDVEHVPIKSMTTELCQKIQISGFACFDFIEEESTGLIYCIECNPRVHSSIVLYDYDERINASIRRVLDGNQQDCRKQVNGPPLAPKPQARPVYWLLNEIGKVLRGRKSMASFVKLLRHGREAVFITEDPLPFLVSNTLQAISNMFNHAITGKQFKIYDHCIGNPR